MKAEVLFNRRCLTVGDFVEFTTAFARLNIQPDMPVILYTGGDGSLSLSIVTDFESCLCGECEASNLLQTCSCEINEQHL